MSVLQTFRRRLGFTRTELVVVLFLSTTLCIGSVLRAFLPGSAHTAPPLFDYSQADSQYFALSKAAADLAITATDQSGGGTRAKAKSLPAKEGININTASAAELTGLPGVGPAIAARIVEYRQLHGRFSSVDDLSNVKGIGPKKLEKLRPYARVR